MWQSYLFWRHMPITWNVCIPNVPVHIVDCSALIWGIYSDSCVMCTWTNLRGISLPGTCMAIICQVHTAVACVLACICRNVGSICPLGIISKMHRFGMCSHICSMTSCMSIVTRSRDLVHRHTYIHMYTHTYTYTHLCLATYMWQLRGAQVH